MEHFDVIVIGSGVAGQTAASELAEGGLSVAIAEARELGGTCALRGCEPKKVLYSAAEPVERVHAQGGHGVAGDARVDWRELQVFKRSFTDPVPEKIESWLADLGVTVLHGAARFTSHETLEVAGVEYAPEHVVVATGAVPISLRVPGEALVIDSEAFLALEHLPEQVAFIGGGFISFEFAHMAAAAGAQAAIVHRSARVLKEFDPDLAAQLAESYRERRIRVLTDTTVIEIRATTDGLDVVCEGGEVVACDLAVHGAGRRPNIDGLALDVAGVSVGKRGIEVDPAMRSTTNPRVFAAGDAAASGPPLTQVGIAQARVAARAILGRETREFDASVTPSVVFSDPPLAAVGLSESQALDRGIDVEVKLTDMTEWAASQRVGLHVAGAKTLVERRTDRIVGAHLLGHHAEEVINVFATAMRGGLTASDLRQATWAYPTASSGIAYLL